MTTAQELLDALGSLATPKPRTPHQDFYRNYQPFTAKQLFGDDVSLGNTVAIERVLTAQLAQLNEKTIRGLPFYDGEIVPFGQPIGVEFQQIADKFLEKQGRSIFMGPTTTTLPTVNASIGEDTYPVRIRANKYGLTYIDLARSSQALAEVGEAPESLLADAAMMVIAADLDDYLAFGDLDQGGSVEGFITNSSVTADTTNAYDPYNAATTYQQHLDFIASLVGNLHRQNRLNALNIRILVPDTMLEVWTTTYQPGDASRSVLENALASNASRGLTGIRALNHLAKEGLDGSLPASLGTAGRDRVVTYIPETMKVHAHTNPVAMWPRVQMDVGFEIPMYQPMSPTIISDLTSMTYTDIITKP